MQYHDQSLSFSTLNLIPLALSPTTDAKRIIGGEKELIPWRFFLIVLSVSVYSVVAFCASVIKNS